MSTPTQFLPLTKRKRSDESTLELSKSPNFWFKDGNIVIQAQNTQYRVHQSILARHSKVFCDMFDLSQPVGESLVEGCAIIHVSDAPKDWQNLFGILYDNDITYNSTEVFSLPVLSAMLRLGRKYDFDKLYATALQRIKIEVPESLKQWDTKYPPKKTSPLDGQEIEVLNVLLEMGIRSLLPVVYFICVKNLTLEDIFRGTTQEDGNDVRLSPDSVQTLILGREKIRHIIATEKFGWFRNYQPGHNPGCSNQIKCDRGTLRLLKALSEFSPGLGLQSPRHIRNDIFCANCYKEIQATDEAARQKMWEDLPIYFGLPVWKDLQ
ncbi:hypothetical protein GALMADRAFT_243642 [Galerina marginata CBS 339.88]|uniref:BTB domain-containing protein n=1 Tax=Galerina marginata (strain CBS 339.88) TaxID=685588 RepID=A0A067TI22_GALM3|nr:hypothetical protein GALMADRAFT_243642 [Galerina marginata CBS 339.88]